MSNQRRGAAIWHRRKRAAIWHRRPGVAICRRRKPAATCWRCATKHLCKWACQMMLTLHSLANMAARAGINGLDPWYSALAITGITADSRQVKPGYLFAALPGSAADGCRFIADAVARGAAAVLAPPGTDWPPGVPPRPLITADRPRRALARMAAEQAGRQPDKIVAVTGTNGKTSTVDFLRQLWSLNHLRAASLGTLGLIAPGFTGKQSGGFLTTPDPVALARMLAELAHAGVNHAAIEASSHGLDQFRLDGVRPSAAGFSNLTRDHLDYHGSIDAYRRAKLRLFEEILPARGIAVVNADMDAQTLAALRDIAQRRRLDLRSVGEQGETLRLRAATPLPHGQELLIEAHGARHATQLALPGRFQADNALMATALAEATGAPQAIEHLQNLAGVRGRMELAATLPHGAAAYVDYAHTPDALHRVLAALRPHAGGNRLICVFGAGGDRDPGKRPLMGQEVCEHADLAIVTDDNPRSENPAAIRAAIMAACPGAREIGDRESAIAAGLSELRAGDVLVVAGKGHEQGQTIGTTTLPFDDAATIRRLAGAP
jgi:UDP-N-acetylmuramoyl-L-alanyl-D-glutamate--2,6-diaminopimelate ligase